MIPELNKQADAFDKIYKQSLKKEGKGFSSLPSYAVDPADQYMVQRALEEDDMIQGLGGGIPVRRPLFLGAPSGQFASAGSYMPSRMGSGQDSRPGLDYLLPKGPVSSQKHDKGGLMINYTGSDGTQYTIGASYNQANRDSVVNNLLGYVAALVKGDGAGRKGGKGYNGFGLLGGKSGYSGKGGKGAD